MAMEPNQNDPLYETDERGPVSRGELARKVGWGALAVSTAILRDKLLQGAALFSFILLVYGVMSKYPVMVAVCVTCGICGLVLFVVALKQKWSAIRQWLLITVLFTVNIALIVAASRLGTR
ncbi:hypothetical protein ACWEO2_16835 [Nocardia sp. NPDC004278]